MRPLLWERFDDKKEEEAWGQHRTSWFWVRCAPYEHHRLMSVGLPCQVGASWPGFFPSNLLSPLSNPATSLCLLLNPCAVTILSKMSTCFCWCRRCIFVHNDPEPKIHFFLLESRSRIFVLPLVHNYYPLPRHTIFLQQCCVVLLTRGWVISPRVITKAIIIIERLWENRKL